MATIMPCIPECLAYSIFKTLRDRMPGITDALETYCWLEYGRRFVDIIRDDIAEAMRVILESLEPETAKYAVDTIIYHLSGGQPMKIQEASKYVREGRLEMVRSILCVYSTSPER